MSSGQFSHAQNLRNIGDVDRAYLYLEKSIYENPSQDSLVSAALLLKSRWLKSDGNYAASIRTLLRANTFTVYDTLNYLIRYELSLNYILNNEFSKAKSQLLQLSYYSKSEFQKNSILPLKILALNELREWQEAEELMKRYVSVNELEMDITELYAFKEEIKLKQVKTARTLNTILPGVGQIYAGYWFKGLLSGTIQAALLGYSAISIYHGYFFTGGVTGVALFYTFYVGGIDLAEELAIKKNKEKIEYYNSRIRDIIFQHELNKKSGK